ncbi:hypothetical protein GOALK_050_02790 [Gordonia alkanivorans NBRC 16433]|uniref:Uncharacterized protein n=1 Tax=Gordonia alkanivorans NBRC 16433 TaxID=1027371 RepID=F9VUY5_9ACTN|nr:hypothetical protein GOALK_050_02790 [Gordonia alkanivorans NBRC 16433]
MLLGEVRCDVQSLGHDLRCLPELAEPGAEDDDVAGRRAFPRNVLLGVPSSELPRSTLPKSKLVAADSIFAVLLSPVVVTATPAVVTAAATAIAGIILLRRMLSKCTDEHGRAGFGAITSASPVTYVTG